MSLLPAVEKQTGDMAWKQNIVLQWTGAVEKHKKMNVSAEYFHQVGTEVVVSYFYHAPFTKKSNFISQKTEVLLRFVHSSTYIFCLVSVLEQVSVSLNWVHVDYINQVIPYKVGHTPTVGEYLSLVSSNTL